MIRVTVASVMAAALVAAAVTGCAGTGGSTGGNTTNLQSIQTRVVDTSDRQRMLRAVIATLQDVGFVLESADAALGRANALRWVRDGGLLDDDGVLRIRMKVGRSGQTQLFVRATIHYGLALSSRHEHLDGSVLIRDPGPYLRFFRALDRTLAREGAELTGMGE